MSRRTATPILFSLLALAALVGSSACTDLRAYEGRWSGSIVSEPAVRQGFSEDARVTELFLEDVALTSLRATLSTSDGRFDKTPLTRFLKSASDQLASLTFESDPLRTYLLFAPPDASKPHQNSALFFISLYTDDKVHLRVLRGNDLYGVFSLERSP